MNEKELNSLANKIVAKIMHVRTMDKWFNHARKDSSKYDDDYLNITLTDEYEAYGEMAKFITLLNLFEEDEDYEKCAIIKKRIDVLNKILNIDMNDTNEI